MIHNQTTQHHGIKQPHRHVKSYHFHSKNSNKSLHRRICFIIAHHPQFIYHPRRHKRDPEGIYFSCHWHSHLHQILEQDLRQHIKYRQRPLQIKGKEKTAYRHKASENQQAKFPDAFFVLFF